MLFLTVASHRFEYLLQNISKCGEHAGCCWFAGASWELLFSPGLTSLEGVFAGLMTAGTVLALFNGIVCLNYESGFFWWQHEAITYAIPPIKINCIIYLFSGHCFKTIDLFVRKLLINHHFYPK